MTHQADNERRLNNIHSLGLIEQIDYNRALCRVRVGDNLTNWLPFSHGRTGAIKLWTPPSIGEQVSVSSPNGDLESGYITHALPTDDNPQPSQNPNTVELHLPNGITLIINHAQKSLTINGLASGNIDIEQLTINGNVSVSGALSAQSVKETTRGIDLGSHRHAAKPPSSPTDTSGLPK